MSAGHREWVERVAAELSTLGDDASARHLRRCGTEVLVQSCGACGERSAAVLVHAWCDVRVCPHCQRATARERVELLSAAALRVQGYCVERVDRRIAEVREDLDQHNAMVERHRTSEVRALAKAARALLRGDGAAAARWDAAAARATARATASTMKARAAQRGLHDLRALELDAHPGRSKARVRDRSDSARAAGASLRWRWRLLTVSPQWCPTDERELTVAGLRRRIADAFARARAVLVESGYGGGLAGWTCRAELSDKGHVHVHALVFGPFLRADWASRAAGCFVDVREIEPAALDVSDLGARAALKDGVREAVKYAVKVPTPTQAAWLLGEPARVLHPALAARWTVATRGVHLVRHGGPMRDAVGAEMARKGAEETDVREGLRCPCCGADLPAGGWRSSTTLAELAALRARVGAEGLRDAWRKRLRYTRCLPGAEVLR